MYADIFCITISDFFDSSLAALAGTCSGVRSGFQDHENRTNTLVFSSELSVYHSVVSVRHSVVVGTQYFRTVLAQKACDQI